MVKTWQNLAKATFNLLGPKMGSIKHFEGVKKTRKKSKQENERLLKGLY